MLVKCFTRCQVQCKCSISTNDYWYWSAVIRLEVCKVPVHCRRKMGGLETSERGGRLAWGSVSGVSVSSYLDSLVNFVIFPFHKCFLNNPWGPVLEAAVELMVITHLHDHEGRTLRVWPLQNRKLLQGPRGTQKISWTKGQPLLVGSLERTASWQDVLAECPDNQLITWV